MPVELYNVVFSGELVDQAAPETARRKLMALFHLDEARVEQLFSGRRIFIKRNLDLDTAARLQDAFRKAGGRALIEPVDAAENGPGPDPDPEPASDSDSDSDELAGAASGQPQLTLAPIGAPLEQIDDQASTKFPNTSALSLVTDQNWTLADCGPPPTPQPEFDLGYLELEPTVTSAAEPEEGQRIT